MDKLLKSYRIRKVRYNADYTSFWVYRRNWFRFAVNWTFRIFNVILAYKLFFIYTPFSQYLFTLLGVSAILWGLKNILILGEVLYKGVLKGEFYEHDEPLCWESSWIHFDKFSDYESAVEWIVEDKKEEKINKITDYYL